MPTNRPFLSNFLAAFRAHSAIQKASTNPPSTSTAPSSPQSTYASSSPSPNAASNPRSITTKANQQQHPGTTTAAVQAAGHLQSARQHSTSPLARSPGSPSSPGNNVSGSASRHRRGSDSSTEGFRDALGQEKWYIGGRTSAGEERYYRLGMAKRHRSIDRLSLDRLSL
ncbi:MAG: hypothetical protein M1819_003600 [Sarea resinae]|nr:MAG: hypothetical protein M1819_003600 [Sarea resinae]